MTTSMCSWRMGEEIDRELEWTIKLFGHTIKGRSRKPPIKLTDCRKYLIYVKSDYRIIVYSIQNKKIFANFHFHESWISDVCVSIAQNTLIAGSFDKSVSVWDFAEKTFRKQYHCNSNVSCVEISRSSGKIIAGCTDGSFYVFSNDENTEIFKNIHKSYPISVKYLENDQLVSIGNDNSVIFWNSSLHQGKVQVWMKSANILSAHFLPKYYAIGFGDFKFRVFKY